MGNIAEGSPVPLNVQLATDDGSLYVQAVILDYLGDELEGSPVALPYISNGNYGVGTFLMPHNSWIKAIYEVYTDSGFTTLSEVYGLSSDTFYLNVSDLSSTHDSPALIGFIDDAQELIGQIVEPD